MVIRGRLVALALIALVAGCAPSATAPTSSPTATALVVASPSPTPVATTAAPSPTPGRFSNPVLGYAVTLPTAWRVSDCISRLELREPVYLGFDLLTWRTVAEDQDLGVPGGTGTAVEMPTGSFILIPALTQHYVFAKGVTITQVHGIGPSGIAYVNPADDPRKP
jgi:hypothetical protein